MLRKFNVNVNGKDYVVEMEEIGAAPVAPVAVAAPAAAAGAPAPAVAAPVAAAPVGEGETIVAPMPGTILSVLVKLGDKVSLEQPLVILEAMKMENEIVAPKAGTVTAVYVTNGSAINVSEPIVTIA